jgi:hypothetical protein
MNFEEANKRRGNKRYMLFPEGYDPMVADGPPEKFYENRICSQPWTLADTERMKLLAEQVTFSDSVPIGRWHYDFEKKEI